MAARWATIAAHLAAIDPEEADLYAALSGAAAALAGEQAAVGGTSNEELAACR